MDDFVEFLKKNVNFSDSDQKVLDEMVLSGEVQRRNATFFVDGVLNRNYQLLSSYVDVEEISASVESMS